MTTPSLDVVVCDYRTPELLADFIVSYNEHRYDGCTLTIADVDPQYDTARFLAEVNSVDYISFNSNVGYGRACNEVVYQSAGTGDVILLANSDTRLSSGLQECVTALMSFDDWGALGPRQVDEFNRITHAGIIGPDTAPRPRAWREPDQGQHSYVDEEVASVAGSLYFVRRKVWEELTLCPQYQSYQPGVNGAFLETSHYYEETFCSYHMRAHGYRAVYYGPVQMIHLWHRASTLGGHADQSFKVSQLMHRTACGLHGIRCE